MNVPLQHAQNPTTAADSSSISSGGRRLPFFLGDLVLVLVFAAIGRASHREPLAGLLGTAWPFLLGTCLAWLLVTLRRWAPGALVPAGLVIWLGTVGIGMLTRSLVGQGTHWSFVMVTLVATGIFLLGVRAVAAGIRRVRGN